MNEPTFIPAIDDPEQSLCVRCGLCCDGTLFERALVSGEDDLALLRSDGFHLHTAGDRTGFALPCHHHCDRVCTVYQRWRPQVCHTFRCALLRRVENRELSWEDASAQIDRTVALADRIWAQLPVQNVQESKSLKQSTSAWVQAQTAAGVDVQRTYTKFMLDFAGLQRLLDLHFRTKVEMEPSHENGGEDVNINVRQGTEHE